MLAHAPAAARDNTSLIADAVEDLTDFAPVPAPPMADVVVAGTAGQQSRTMKENLVKYFALNFHIGSPFWPL